MWKWWRIIRRTVIGLTVAAALTVFGLGIYQTQRPFQLVAEAANLGVKSQLQVRFSRQVNEHFNYNLTPAVAGTWREEMGWYGVKGMVFTPRTRWPTSAHYSLILGGIKSQLTGQVIVEETALAVSTAPAPAVVSLSPADGMRDVAVAPPLQVTVRLKSPNHEARQLSLQLTPAMAATALPPSPDDTSYSWRIGGLKQGVTYTATLSDSNVKDPTQRVVGVTHFTTVAEPVISSTTPQNHLYPGGTVTVKFAQAMVAEHTNIRFDLAGSGRWADASTYVYTPTGLTPGKTYTYTVVKDATSTVGGVLEADHNFTVSTPGAVYVSGMSPTGTTVSRAAAIRIGFDQPVDHASAQAHFSISPTVAGSFGWSGSTLIFTPSGLDYQTTYTVNLTAGIVPGFGLPSARNFGFSFTTEYQIARLNVPYFRQPYNLSCEATALKMALAYRGIGAGELDLLNRFGYNPRPRDTGANFWDDPYQMFVGDVNGRQNSTGFGVYAGPVAAVARSYGRGASSYGGVSASFIAEQIYAGNPVIIWGSSISPQLDSWNSPGGVVQAWIGEHTRVVVGVVGSPAAPSGFYLHDPVYGANIYWSTGQLVGNLNSVGGLSNQAVVVQ